MVQRLEIREATQQLVNTMAHILNPFREDMEEYFKWVKEVKEEEKKQQGKPEGYDRRPTIGLQIQIDGIKRLAIRPGWLSQGTYHHRNGIEYNPSRYFSGDIEPGIITLELLGPGKLMTLKLTSNEIKLGTAYNKDDASGTYMDRNKDAIHDIILTAHRLLKDPWEKTFKESARLSERCCCCRKELTTLESRSRGIGPECITKFPHLHELSPVGKKYSQKYRNIDDPWDHQP